jgi:protein O-mannosyl-transferase
LKTARPGYLYLAVTGCAIAVYLHALLNGYALDDVPIVAANPLVHGWSGLWRAFGEPYWPPSTGSTLYRPLVLASYALDWRIGGGGAAWFHLVNLAWHAGVSVAVAGLAHRWTGSVRAALLAGTLFAVHPVHVEAVANVVGRAELMAALFAMVSVLLALEYDRPWWSLAAWVPGLLSKETAVVVPALVAAGWIIGVGRRPPARRMAAYGAGWMVLGSAYLIARWSVLHSAPHQVLVAPVFVGASPLAVRLTAVSSFTDFVRLLVFPLKLSADYSPGERTLVTSLLDVRLTLGVLCFLAWLTLTIWAWRSGRRLEAFGLCWIAVALLPVANLVLPVGVLVAERTLYLPSVGFALAVAARLKDVPARRLGAIAVPVLLAGGMRTALRVPVWRDTGTVSRSVLRDSPRSYINPLLMAGTYLARRQADSALESIRASVRISDQFPKALLWGADIAFQLRDPRLADSLLARLDRTCSPCPFYYEFEARAALSRGDSAVADSFVVRAAALRQLK